MILMTLQMAAFLALAAYFWRRFQTVFNPPTLFLLSIASTQAGALIVHALGDEIGVHGYFDQDLTPLAATYALAGATFVAIWLKPSSARPILPSATADPSPVEVTYFAALTSLALIAVAAYNLGGIPLLRMLDGAQDIMDHVTNLELLPPGLMAGLLLCNFILALYCSTLWFSKVRAHRIAAWVGLAAFFVGAFWQGNRQLLLLFLLVFGVRLVLERERRGEMKLSLARTARVTLAWAGGLALFIYAFNAVRAIRLDGRDAPFEILGYFAWPVFNLQNIVHFAHEARGEMPFLLAEILPSRFGSLETLAFLRPVLVEPTSPSGYLAYWFLDFGYLGVAAGAALLALSARLAYNARHDSEPMARIYTLLAWCSATVGVYSHFITTNFFLLPMAFCVAMQLALGKRRVTEEVDMPLRALQPGYMRTPELPLPGEPGQLRSVHELDQLMGDPK